MRRREFVRTGAWAGAGVFLPRRRWIVGPPTRAGSVLVPMDDAQDEHLKAYGLAFRSLDRGDRGEWLLNYRNGSFLLAATDALQRDAALAGVSLERVDDNAVATIKGEIQASNMDAVPLEKAPKVAVYAPPDAAPWDDAVTMALNYAGIQFEQVWDPEVIAGGLDKFDWLHLHHEDFTGQYSKFVITSAGAPWLQAMMQLHQSTAARLGFANVPDLKRAVAQRIAAFVERGGFLFAMCTATETLDLALASDGVDIAAAYADGTPMDPQASSKMHWDKALAFQDAQLELSPVARRRSATSTATRSTPPNASRSAPSTCSTSAPRSIRWRRCWCRTIARSFRISTASRPRSGAVGSSRRHGAGRRTGRAVGQVHSRRAGQGHLDVLRRPRSGGSAARRSATRRPTCRCIRIRRATG